jgi:hypothetical protein
MGIRNSRQFDDLCCRLLPVASATNQFAFVIVPPTCALAPGVGCRYIPTVGAYI